MKLINILGLPLVSPIILVGFLAWFFESLGDFLANIIPPVVIAASFVLPVAGISYGLYEMFGG